MEKEYIKFKNRNYGYKGDKGTWAAIHTDNQGNKTLVINKAANGIISSPYTDEITQFAAGFGIDFTAMRSGEKKEVEYND